jgi:6-pyruvoyltetrahydropterin/6-carboxytetrahydropterin synthase
MIRATVTKRFTFEASHALEHHDGACRRWHGHSYKLFISVSGMVKPVLPGVSSEPLVMGGAPVGHGPTTNTGEVLARREVQKQHGVSVLADEQGNTSLSAVAAPSHFAPDCGMVMDFARMSEIVKERVIAVLDHRTINEVLSIYPTAENIAHWIWEQVEGALPRGVVLEMVRLQETESCWVDVFPSDRQ